MITKLQFTLMCYDVYVGRESYQLHLDQRERMIGLRDAITIGSVGF